MMTPARSPSPSSFFAGYSSPPPIPDDLDDMIADALRHLPERASRAEIGAWLEANYDGFDHEAHSFDLTRRLRANVERGMLSMERCYRLRTEESETRAQLKRAERAGTPVNALQRKRRTMMPDEPLTEPYSSDASMDNDLDDDPVTPS